MSFTERLWASNRDLLDTILTMPFNTELANGTLPLDTFRRYIIQDAHYLEGFSRALALSASRAPDADAIAQLAGSASGAIAVERQLHGKYMSRFDVSQETFQKTLPSRACDHYVNSVLRSAATDPFPVAVASLLPCFWIYQRVGSSIRERADQSNPYWSWIETYASEAFEATVLAMLKLTDRLAESDHGQMRKAMENAFAKSCWHEWMFWHSAYNGQDWPDPFQG